MGDQSRRRRVRLVDAMLLGTVVNQVTAVFLIGIAPAERVAQLAVIGFSEALIVSVTWLAFAIVGAIIVRHQPDNVIGWACAAGGLGPSLVALSVAIATYLFALDSGSRPGQFVAWVSHVGAMALFAAPLFLMFRYPTGRPLGPRSARLERLWVGLFIALLVAGAVAPISLVGFTAVPNPFALQGAPRVPFFGFLGASVAALLIAGTATLVVRHRHGSWLERRQIALLGGAAALVAVDAAMFPLTSPGFTSAGQLTVATYFVTTLASSAPFGRVPSERSTADSIASASRRPGPLRHSPPRSAARLRSPRSSTISSRWPPSRFVRRASNAGCGKPTFHERVCERDPVAERNNGLGYRS